MSKHSENFYLDGEVVRWKSNDRVPPEECLVEMYESGEVTPIQVYKSMEAHEKETAEFLKQYQKRMETHVYSDEELFEMRAAFGEGAEVVNAVTGQTIKL